MAIYGAYFASLGTPGGSGGTSNSISWLFGQPVNISAQAAVGGIGGTGLIGEVGFSSCVQGGTFKPIGGEGYGTWDHVIFLDNVTEVDISARSWDGWVTGTAVANAWDVPIQGNFQI
ncbi:hypothetical protein [Streptomyces sp. NPDC002537]